MHFFCPACWHEVNDNETICPHCHESISAIDREPYDKKLIRALNHPEQQTVLRVIQILGDRHNPDTLPYLAEKLNESDNPYIQKALIMAIANFKLPVAKEIINKYTDRQYSVIVRECAAACLKYL